MRRTYRSKKDAGGGLDHRDVLLNLDEKSSAFDAFYIQNIKQTKRELSSIGSSNHYGAASNRVRKRKYVKRIVKEIEPSRRETQSHSVFLTPDKSMRVNKPLDPFDMLLNSSSAPEAPQKFDGTNSSEHYRAPRRPAVTYTRKKPSKKMNYTNSDTTDSDKENSSELSSSVQNATDIKAHQLLVEREPNASPKYGDESINNIVKNLSIFNNLKQSNSNKSFKTPKFNKNRLTRSIQSPILQRSPLCSTPFKEKYRSQSIYKFSPIPSTSNNASPNLDSTQRSSGSNDSVILVCKHGSLENYIQSPVTHTIVSNNDNYVETAKSTERNEQLVSEYCENNSIQDPVEENANVDDKITSVLPHSDNLSCNEISSGKITEIEPFLGFSSNEANELINVQNKIQLLCSNVMQSNLKQCEELDESKVNDTKSAEGSQNSVQFSLKETVPDVDNDKISSDTESDDKESLYDTCESEQLSDQNVGPTVPVVKVEKMSDSLFLKYYEMMTAKLHIVQSQNSEEAGEINKFEVSYNTSGSNTDITDEISSYDTTDVSTNEDATTSNGTASSSNNEEQYISFVTTRRRKAGTSKSIVSFFDNSYGSGSGELEKTVLSTNTKKQMTDLNQSNNIEDSKSNEIELNNVGKKSFVKRRRRRYSKSNYDISSPVNTDSDDNSKDVSLYAFAPTTENPDDAVISQQRKSINRRCRKSRKSQETDMQSSTNPENSNDLDVLTNDEINSVTISDNPLECIDSDDVIENIDTKVTVNMQKSNHNEHIEDAINIVSSVSGSSDNEVTLQAEPPDTAVRDSNNEKILINFRNNTRLLRRSTVEKQRNEKCKPSNQFKSESMVQNKHSVVGERVSSITTRKSSRVFHESMGRSPDSSRIVEEPKGGIVLQPGKKWERSLSIYRRMTMMTDQFDHSILDESLQTKGRKYRQSVISTMELQDTIGSVHNESINSRRSTFVSKPSRSTIRIVNDINSTRTSLYSTAVFDELQGFLADDCDDTIVELSKLSIADAEPEVTVLELHETSNRLATAKDYVLRRCIQTDAILFDECYPDTVLKNCHKIGEGVYGEVFLWRDRDGRARVMKIVPVAGNTKVNGEDQKDFSEIISEIVIAMELSALRAPIADIERHFDEGNDASALDLHTIENATDVFNEVLAVRCVYGGYPSRLLDLWDLYDECKGSENDNPAILPVDQQYIVLELANAGQDLESYQFNNAEQAYALFYQVAFGLAVGEEAYQFEHRDLHWGNILIAPTEQKYATFVVRGRVHRVLRRGVAASIIDYSLSRVCVRGAGAGAPVGAALYNDLAADDGLFDAVGDYQFQVYRLMRDKLGNDWKNFEPYTNILWLHYTVDKMITALRYKRTNTKIHKHYIEKLKGLKNRILDYKSAAEFVLVDNEY